MRNTMPSKMRIKELKKTRGSKNISDLQRQQKLMKPEGTTKSSSFSSANSGERPNRYKQQHEKSRSSSSSSICSKSSVSSGGGIVKVEFEDNVFRSSSFLRVNESTTAQEVLEMALKKAELDHGGTRRHSATPFVLLGIFSKPEKKKWGARTLKSNEKIRLLQQDYQDNPAAAEESPFSETTPVKYLLKDTRRRPFDIDSMPLEEENDFGGGSIGLADDVVDNNMEHAVNTSALQVQPTPVASGNSANNNDHIDNADDQDYRIHKFSETTGIYRGCLMKQSKSDDNVWRSRWFILQEDHIIYCKASDHQSNVGRISLLSAKVKTTGSKNKDSHEFIIACKNRSYHMYASTTDEKARWVSQLEVQIRNTVDAQGLLAAENAIYKNHIVTNRSTLAASDKHPLHDILLNLFDHELFKEFMKTDIDYVLYCGWIQCERFRAIVTMLNQHQQSVGTTYIDSWKLAKKILDDTVPKILLYQGEFHTRLLDNFVALSGIRARSREEMRQHRIRLATSDDDYVGAESLKSTKEAVADEDMIAASLSAPPDSEAFSDLQSQLFDLLAAKNGPYERFLQSLQFAKIAYKCLPR